MILEKLKKEYRPLEPICLSYLNLQMVQYNNMRQIFKRLTDAGEVIRYDQGIYYLPDKKKEPNFETVIRKLYIQRGREIFGYEGAESLAMKLHLIEESHEIPVIVTNKEMSRGRNRIIHGQRLYLKKPYCIVNNQNAPILQLLDLIAKWNDFSGIQEEEKKEIIMNYMKKMKIKQQEFKKCILYYPARVSKKMLETELYSVLI